MTRRFQRVAILGTVGLAMASGCGESAADRAQREKMEASKKASQMQQVLENMTVEEPTPPTTNAPTEPEKK